MSVRPSVCSTHHSKAWTLKQVPLNTVNNAHSPLGENVKLESWRDSFSICINPSSLVKGMKLIYDQLTETPRSLFTLVPGNNQEEEDL